MSVSLGDSANMYDAFLSYKSSDRPLVLKLARMLEERAKIRVFLDRWHLIPGEPWQEELESALERSRTCVACIGGGGIGPWQNEEMRTALDRQISCGSGNVIPVLLPGVDDASINVLPPFLRRLTAIDMRLGFYQEGAFEQLVSGIQGAAPKNSTSRAEPRIQFQIVLSAQVDDVNLPLLRAITKHLQGLSGDARLTIVRVDRGSVILTVECTPDAMRALQSLWESGQLVELQRLKIAAVRPVLAASEPATSEGGGMSLFVSNLPYSIRDDALRLIFEQFGPVLSSKVMLDPASGLSTGMGFVEMASAEDARRAIAALGESQLDGRTLGVKLSGGK